MLEEFNFIENCILFLGNRKNQGDEKYSMICYQIKTILSMLLLSKGGINFFSKNFEKTKLLREFLFKITTKAKNAYPLLSEENFFSFRDIEEKDFLFNASELSLDNVIISKHPNLPISDRFIANVHLLQLYYMIEANFVVLLYF